jgi:hypothetical protein
LHLLQKKKKDQFIPLPWKVGEFVLKNINKINEFAVHSSIFNLRYAESIRGFNPDNIFRQHLQTLGLGDCFFKKHLPENIDTDDKYPSSDASDLDIVQSYTTLYTQ